MGCRNLSRGDFENLYKIALAKSDGHINEVAVTKVMLLTPLETLEEHRSNLDWLLKLQATQVTEKYAHALNFTNLHFN
jgi:hypothetical protein